MSHRIRRINYFYATIEDGPGSSFDVLSRLASLGVSLVALAALPLGPARVQLALFPDDDDNMARVARDAGMTLDGPHPAILVQGDDTIGALADVHERLARADINLYASNGVTDGRGSYGYVIYVRPNDVDRALSALQA